MGLFGSKKNKVIQNSDSATLTTEEFIQYVEKHSKEQQALKLSAVYSAISIRSNTMSKIPFSIINRFTKEKFEDDNLYNILNMQPNPKMNASVFKKLLSTWELYFGNAYGIPLREPRSTKVIGIAPVHPDKVKILTTDKGEIQYEIDMGDKKPKKYRYDEIIHFKAMTLDGVEGLSPLEYARETVATGVNQEDFSANFYKNYGRPLDYLKTQTDLSSKDKTFKIKDKDGNIQEITKSLKDVLRDEWKKAHTGENKFAIAILDNGLEYGTVPQITPEQMQFVNSKVANVEDIARFFDMASCSFKLGIGKQTYSNNEQGQICYVTETIVPTLNQWEQELTLKLLTAEQRKEGLVIKGNINAELRGDTAARATWYDKMQKMGAYSLNEIRAYEDMPSIGKNGDARLIGANSIPLERLLAGETAASATPNDLGGDNNE